MPENGALPLSSLHPTNAMIIQYSIVRPLQRGSTFEDVNGNVLVNKNHFMHIIHTDKLTNLPQKRLIFLMDKSGSMNWNKVKGLGGHKKKTNFRQK